MRLLVFDNYDSFTYNLVHLIDKISGKRPDVCKNDRISIEEIANYDKIVLSPGPGLPSESGLLMELIEEYAKVKPILGVCLGHQAIAQYFGAQLVNLPRPFHGVAHSLKIVDSQCQIFKNVSEGSKIGLYHSWVVSKNQFPNCLRITAEDEFGNVMALEHTSFDVTGVQFHPESILSTQGEEMLRNWLNQ